MKLRAKIFKMIFDIRNAERFIKSVSDNSYSLDNYVDGRERKIHSITSLQFESVRLATFYYFRNERQRVNPKDLAKNGYYYDRFYDYISCSFCSIKAHQENNYNVASTHRSTKNNCPMNKPLNGNVPQADPDAEDSFSKINHILQEFMTHKVKYAVPDETSDIVFNDRFRFNAGEKNFSEYNLRLATFSFWFAYLPLNSRPNKERYAEAGFVCTGISDIVMCYKCKGGLFNIHASDDPVKDHVTFYGHCTFIRDYCSNNNIEFNHTPEMIPEYMFAEHEQELLMEHPMMKDLISKDVDKSIIKRTIFKFLHNGGCFPIDIEACMEMIKKVVL